jgi:hypothetical protein
MCQVKAECERTARFWVQSRREISFPGQPELNIEPFKSGVSSLSCARHLAQAVREIGELNRKAADGIQRPATDGVVVKQRTMNGAWL